MSYAVRACRLRFERSIAGNRHEVMPVAVAAAQCVDVDGQRLFPRPAQEVPQQVVGQVYQNPPGVRHWRLARP
jgi:hypothetical protein